MEEEKKAPRRVRAATLGRNHPQAIQLIEERKVILFERQAGEHAEWLSAFLKTEIAPDFLSSLKKGLILLLLIKKIDPSKCSDVHVVSQDSISEAQAQANLKRFLECCKELGVSDDDLFSLDDLKENGNYLRVFPTLRSLRKLSEELPSKQTQTPEKEPQLNAEGKSEFKKPVLDSKRSVRLFDDVSSPRPFSARGEGFFFEPRQGSLSQTLAKEVAPEKDEETESGESEESDADTDFGDEFNPEFVDPLTPDIMARLLSKEVSHFEEGDFDEDASEDEGYEIDDGADEEEYHDDDIQPTQVIQEQDELIKILSQENERLQELLETQVISQHKEFDMGKERIDRLLERELELQDAADAAEARAKKAEAALAQLKATLDERDKSLALISRMAKEKETYLYYANVKIIQLVEKLEKNNIPETPTLAQIPSAETTPTVVSPPVKEEAAPAPTAQEPKPDVPTTEELQTNVERRDSAQNANRRINKRRSAVISHSDFLKTVEDLFPSKAVKPVVSLESSTHQYRIWKQHPDAAAILPTMSANDVDRQEIIYEFVATETSYNRDLDLIVRRFIQPLKEIIGTPKFTQTDFENIFRNLETIIRVNAAFLVDLQQRNTEQWPVINNIGDIFLKHSPFFEAYAEYCGDQQRSVTEMRRADDDNIHVRDHLEKMLLEKECRKLDVYAFLLLPMQRVTKYPLLLKSLLKKTSESHPDYAFLKASLSEIDHTIKSINDYTKRRDEIARILTIDKQLDCSLIKTPINLGNSEAKGRSLIREGLLTRLRLKNRRLATEKSQGRKLEKLQIFFFSDLLVVTKPYRSTPESPPRYVVQVKPLRYQEMAIRIVPDSSNGIGAKNIFLLSSQATGTLVLQASTPAEKNDWINDFRKADLIAKSLLKLESEVDLLEAAAASAPAPAAVPAPAPAASLAAPESVALVRSLTKGKPRPQSMATDVVDEMGEVSQIKEDSKHSWFLGAKKPETFLDITAEQLSQPEFDGWLKVLSKGAFQRPVWKWRYCVLKDFVLYFFLGEDQSSKATSLLVLPGHSIVAQKGVNKKNVFEVRHPTNIENIVHLSADTPEYMNIWVEAMTHATHSRIAPRNFWL